MTAGAQFKFPGVFKGKEKEADVPDKDGNSENNSNACVTHSITLSFTPRAIYYIYKADYRP